MDSSVTLTILLFLTIFTSPLSSQTIISGQSNYPSDVWTKENSPYIIEGPLGLEPSSTLIIQPGVIVKFKSGAQLSVNDTEKLFALGTSDEKIIFTSAEEEPQAGDWTSIWILDSENNVKLRHCIIEYARTGISINSTISRPFQTACPDENSFPIIENCIIRFIERDGISCSAAVTDPGFCPTVPTPNTAPVVVDCEIYECGNHGINLLAGNRGNVSGMFLNNIIYDNLGDGISTDLNSSGSLNPQIKNNTIVNNRINGIQFNNLRTSTSFEISNNIITGSSFGLFTVGGALPMGGYNNIWNNLIDYEGLDPLAGDISEDPLFLNDEQKDFRLTLGSPCIDAGNPSCPVDPDSTIADIGALYFDQTFFSDFEADDLVGTVPTTVQFSELSILGSGQVVDDWYWDFGDGSTSEEQNPQHTYTQKGKFSVSLTISNATFTHTKTKSDFICILNSPPQVVSVPGTISFDEDTNYTSLDLSSVFVDPDGDSLIYPPVIADHLTIQITADGQVQITPEANWHGSEEVVFKAKDNEEATTTLTLKVVVRPVNDPPIIIAIHPQNTIIDTTDTELTFSVEADDVDNALEYNWFVNGNAGLGSSHQFSYLFNEGGTFEVVCEITDGVVTVDTSWTVHVMVNRTKTLPEEIEEIVVYPNPFHLYVEIDIKLRKSTYLTVEIWSTAGQKLAQLFEGKLSSGLNKIRWGGFDNLRAKVPPGLYLLKFQKDDQVVLTRKIVRF